MTDLEKAREFFGGDLYATKMTGIQIDEVGEHYARCSLELTDDHRNAYGGVFLRGCSDFSISLQLLLMFYGSSQRLIIGLLMLFAYWTAA